MATLGEIAVALAEMIGDAAAGLGDVQVAPFYVSTPAQKLCIDVYPADPSQEDAAFGPASTLLVWTVRARASTADDGSGQDSLLALMEPFGGASIRGALNADVTLGDLVESLDCDRPSGFQEYGDAGVGGSFGQGRFIGFQQRVRVYSTSEPES